jgi:cytochrome c peroxidase
MKSYFYIILIISVLPLVSCKKDISGKPNPELPIDVDDSYIYNTPSYFPALNYPNDNKPTRRKFELGKKLFFDKLLSKENAISCGSCHFQNLAFSDSVQFSIGSAGQLGERNSPTLTNIGYNSNFFWDGGVPTLELQALAPLDNHKEFDLPYDSLLLRLNNNSNYKQLFMAAFNEDATLNNYTKALACYQRAFISGNSKYDDYFYRNNSKAFTASELSGFQLFINPTIGCNSCHSGFNFTNGGFENNGLSVNYKDAGRYKVTGYIQDLAKFKVPTLRNVALTAPYMHDGSFATLTQVIDHYDSGGQAHSSKSPKVKPLNLTTQQKTDLVNFLKTLTDDEFIKNQDLKP